MMKTNEYSELQNLVNINKDASTFYNQAFNITKTPSMRSLFSNLESMHRASMMSCIEHMKTLVDDDIESDETVVGKTQQMFGKLVAKTSNDTDEALIVYLEEAEDRCLKAAKNLAQKDDLSASTELLAKSELSRLRKTHDYMKSLKEEVKKAA
jgi:uncharacterized protein (TIGR02284 family)